MLMNPMAKLGADPPFVCAFRRTGIGGSGWVRPRFSSLMMFTNDGHELTGIDHVSRTETAG